MSSDITLYGSDGNPVIVTGDEMKVHGIESGSNANANWTKYPDGTLVWTHILEAEWASHLAPGEVLHMVTISAPIPTVGHYFASGCINMSVSDSGAWFPLSLYQLDSDENLHVYNQSDITFEYANTYRFTVIGRWK